MYELKPDHAQLKMPVSIQSLIEWGMMRLENDGIDEARLQAELLLCEVLKCTRADLRTGYNDRLDDKSIKQYEEFLNRRRNHEPLQYILGSTEFMGLRFIVNKSVFIPRPETELLVEIAREICLSHKGEINHLLDVGTGSGNIAVSIARTCESVTIDAVDSDREALVVADENIKLHDLRNRIRTINCDVFDECGEITRRRYDMVVSNPPYIPLSEFLTLEPEVRDFEPRAACTDGAHGLTFYDRIAKLCKSILRDGGYILVEIGYDQSQRVCEILSHAGFQNIKVWKDYSGHDRIVRGEWRSQ
jgi:release factor glutamine methyltransferase